MKFSLASKTILVIDDYAAMRRAIRDMLYTLEAVTVIEASNGVGAINAMMNNRFDVVLCDYNLGDGKNGQQVLEEARLRKLIGQHCVFVIISAEQSTSMVLGAMDGKPDEYLAKPFNAQQLAGRLQRHFERKSFLAGVETEVLRGNLPKAIKLCDALLASGDKKMQTHLIKLRAELAINSGDYETARNLYRDILANRELPWAKLGLGIVEFRQNHYEHAVAIFEQLLKAQPMMMEVYDWLSKAYEELHKLSDAQAILSQAVHLTPQSILRQKKLAVTAERNGHFDVAEKAYQATMHIGKYSIHKSCEDFAGLAKVYTKTNAADKALHTLAEMRKEFLNSPEAELRSATIETELQKNLGNEDLAKKAFDKMLELSNRLPGKIPKDVQLDMVKTCFLSNEKEKAKELLESLIKTHVDDEAFLDTVREMQKDIGEEDFSETLIQKTKQMLIATNNRGVALYKQGKFAEAMALFETAMASMPDNKTIILNMLKIILHDLKFGDFHEDKLLRAKELLKRAQQIGIDPHKLGILKLECIEISQQRLIAG
jgi:tetratricopeptide (TPR) repeat protein